MRALVVVSMAVVAVAASGCFTEFTGYVTEPTICNPVGAGGGAPREYAECVSGATCIFADVHGQFSSTTTNCFPSLHSSSAPGDPCTAANDCAQGQACGGFGCTTLCFTDRDCPSGVRCVDDGSSRSINARAVHICQPAACSLVGRDCTVGCSPSGTGFTACRGTAGPSGAGETCASDSDCAKDLACDDATLECSRYCRPDGEDCGSGVACLTDGRAPVVVDGVSYGYCAR